MVTGFFIALKANVSPPVRKEPEKKVWCYFGSYGIYSQSLFATAVPGSYHGGGWYHSEPVTDRKKKRISPCRPHSSSIFVLFTVVLNVGLCGLADYIIVSLAIRQCAAWSSTLITRNFPERRKPRKQKETHTPSIPPFCANFRLVCSILCPCPFLLTTFCS